MELDSKDCRHVYLQIPDYDAQIKISKREALGLVLLKKAKRIDAVGEVVFLELLKDESSSS